MDLDLDMQNLQVEARALLTTKETAIPRGSDVDCWFDCPIDDPCLLVAPEQRVVASILLDVKLVECYWNTVHSLVESD